MGFKAFLQAIRTEFALFRNRKVRSLWTGDIGYVKQRNLEQLELNRVRFEEKGPGHSSNLKLSGIGHSKRWVHALKSRIAQRGGQEMAEHRAFRQYAVKQMRKRK